MELVKSNVIFDAEKHTYTTPDGVQLQGITGMLSRQLFPDKYADIPNYVLNKAAERGHFIHEVCEMIDELGVTHESEEGRNYERIKTEYGLEHEASEYLVSDGKHFASCIDKVYRENDTDFTLADIKTTYTLDREYVRWQLSIYAYLFELQNTSCRVVRLAAIWLRGSKSVFAEVERIPDATIVALLQAEIDGVAFVNPLPIPESESELPTKYREMEQAIAEIDRQERYWHEQKKVLMDGVMREMVRAGVYKWQGEQIAFCRKKDSLRKTFDRERFEHDFPGVYEKYLLETPVSGSVTLKVK